MSSRADAHIAAEAQQTARHMFEDINSHKPNGLERAIDEIAAERRTHTPAEFRQYMAELNKDIQPKLPGLTIVDASDVGGTKTLSISQRSGPRRLDQNDGADLALEIKYQAMLANSRTGMPTGQVAVERKEHHQ